MKLFHLFSLLQLFLCFYAIEAAIKPLQVTHPLDPLTQQEITLVQTIVLKKYPKPANRVFFHYIGLDDPDKAAVLKWLSSGARTPRNAFAIALINNQVHELTVNLLSPRNVASDKIHAGNGFPTLTEEEQTEAIELLPKYGPYVESLKKRGFNVSQVACTTFSIGWFGETKSIRAVKLECFSQDGSPNIYVRPISGLTVLVDLDKMKIVEYHDDIIKPVPTAENTEYRASHLKPPFGPKLHSWSSHQPDGPGYTLNGHSIMLGFKL